MAETNISQKNILEVSNRSFQVSGLSSSADGSVFTKNTSNASSFSSVVQSSSSKYKSQQLLGDSSSLESSGTSAASSNQKNAESFSAELNNQRSVADPLGINPHGSNPLDPNNQDLNISFKVSPFTTTSQEDKSQITFFNFKDENADPFDRVKIRFKQGHPMSAYPGMLKPLAKTGGMVFPFKPTVSITSSINYENISLVHAIQDLKCFNSNSAPIINIQGTFVSKTVDDAMYTLAAIHFMRCVTKMSFGSGSREIDGIPLGTPNGSPPPILLLSGYGVGMMNDLPVIVTGSVPFEFPADVDYVEIPTGIAAGTKVPTLYNMNISLTVQRSVDNMREFNLDYFTRYGTQGWW